MNIEMALSRQDWRDVTTAAIIFGGTLVLAFLVSFILRQLRMRLAGRTVTKLDEIALSRLTAPVVLAVLLGGIYVALLQVAALDDHRQNIRTYFVVAATAVGFFAVARVINTLLEWYGADIARRTQTDLDEKLVPVFRRLINVVVYAVALIIILDRLGVEISPLIAGLGIGGLAVALALQPTLSSFLAGTFVMADGVIKRGDYIELDSGQAGFVEEIGWRTTKIRHWQGNLIVFPNSRLADAIVTNYEAPEPPMLFTVPGGVSYDSDLGKVERVALEVARQVIRDCPDAAKEFEPVLRFREFGDSNINFVVVLRAVNRVGQFLVRHQFIKALHQRFAEEGIEIQYPARKLYFSGEVPLRLSPRDLDMLVGGQRGNPTPDEQGSPCTRAPQT